jgi:hypothetical protein
LLRVIVLRGPHDFTDRDAIELRGIIVTDERCLPERQIACDAKPLACQVLGMAVRTIVVIQNLVTAPEANQGAVAVDAGTVSFEIDEDVSLEVVGPGQGVHLRPVSKQKGLEVGGGEGDLVTVRSGNDEFGVGVHDVISV